MIRTTGYRVLSMAARPYQWMRSNGLTILAFHDVPDRTRFRGQMAWLAGNAHPIGLREGCDLIESGGLPRRAVVVTFDDGDPTVIETALPVLEEFDVPATLFVCPAFVDSNEPFWWEVVSEARSHGGEPGGSPSLATIKQWSETRRRGYVSQLLERYEAQTGGPIQRMQVSSKGLATWFESGRTLGNHTWSHPILDKCDPETQEREIMLAHEWLAERYGEVSEFAYPNGNHSRESERVLVDLGYRVGLLFDHRRHVGGVSLRMSRVRVNATDTPTEFKAKASGLHPFIRRLARPLG